MQAILDQIADWLKGMLVDGIMNNLANFETWIIFKWIFKTTWISDHEDLNLYFLVFSHSKIILTNQTRNHQDPEAPL